MNGSCGCTAEMAANGTRPCDVQARQVMESLFGSSVAGDPMHSFLGRVFNSNFMLGGDDDGRFPSMSTMVTVLPRGIVMAVSEVSEPDPAPAPGPGDAPSIEEEIEQEIEELEAEGGDDEDASDGGADDGGTDDGGTQTETSGLVFPPAWAVTQERDLVTA